MRQSSLTGQKLYRLELDGSRRITPRLVEFEAHGCECALTAIGRSGADGVVAIFEDGRQLARVRPLSDGLWWVNPPRLGPT